MKTIGAIIGTLLLIFALATCSAANDATNAPTGAATESVSAANTADNTAATTTTATDAAPVAETLAPLSAPHTAGAASDSAAGVVLTLNGATIAVEGEGVSSDGSTATITAGGTYTLRGVLADGQIVVDTKDAAPVYLVLDGVELYSNTSAPIFVRNAAQVVLVLADGTQNTITDAATYVFADPAEDEPNAALFSKANLTITGNGALIVMGNYNDGIASKDGLVIESGAITVNAVDDGIRGKDYLVIKDGALAVTAGGDGLKADNAEDATLGYIAIDAGTITVTASGDAITAQSQVRIASGDFALLSGGGHTAIIDDTLSAKGIKSAVGVQIDGGAFIIDAADDAIHANASIVINGGVFTIASGDDGMHADGTLTINGGEIAVTSAYEGIESAVITVNGGDIHILASDDGVNVAGGVDGSGMMRGGPGGRPPGGASAQDASAYTGDYYLYINGGRIVVDAAGDGIDVNGAIVMTDGVVIVHGPTMNGNGALDYDAGFTLEGGIVVAVGSAGMAQTPGAGIVQHALLLNYTSMLPAGTLIHIQDSAGNAILTFAPTKEYQSLAFSSPALVTGETYTVYSGGSSNGTATDGLVAGGYTPGTEYTTFTVAGGVTMIGGRVR